MIVYFSATGNSRYTAQRIAEAIGDSAVSMEDIKGEITLQKGERLGIITPTYYLGLPLYVKDFMENVKIVNAENTYIYYIATYGTSCGQTGKIMKQYLARKGLAISACYSVRMPDTWTPTFDLSDPQKVAATQAKEPGQINEIIGHINSKCNGDYMKRKVPMAAVKLYSRSSRGVTDTSHLHVEEQCIGCGLCAENCPMQAIRMKDSKPVWVKDQCAMCLRCLHHCPVFAIQYDDRTQKHGQYVHP